MKSSYRSGLIVCLFLLTFVSFVSTAGADDGKTVHYVSGQIPVQHPSRELAADLPAGLNVSHPVLAAPTSAPVNNWQLQASLPGAVIHDISFPTLSVGYVAAELGQVWKTTDGGAHWTMIMNLGSPYFWYGVQALNANDVIISGFIDSASVNEGVARWSHDGGATWSADIVLTTTAWSFRVRFADSQKGLIVDGANFSGGNPPNSAHYTIDAGATATDWTTDVIDPNGAWFEKEFSLLSNQHARASGVTYCDSTNGGVNWSCRPSIDSVFDGETFFVDDLNGWVSGGLILTQHGGWVHRTTDGGKTWSGRTLNASWPIRELRFRTPQIGWAAGGDIYSNAGGIYFSNDGGQTWSLDLDSGGYEMDACDSRADNSGNFQIWCAGYNHLFNGIVYTLQLQVVTPAPTATVLSSSMNPAPAGQSVTFTATVSSAANGTPAGTVDFKDGTTTIAAGQALNGSGVATFSTSTLAIGEHSITAVYSGDSGHVGGTSSVLTQVINNSGDTGTSTALNLIVTPPHPGQPRNSVELGQSAVLTATVTPSPGSNGTVTFTDGIALSVSVPLADGVSTLDVSKLLTVGQHTILATYTGGGGFQGSLSAPLTVLHSPRPK